MSSRLPPKPPAMPGPGQLDFVLERAVQAVDVGARRHVLEVGREQLAAGRADALQRLRLLRQDRLPVRLGRLLGIDQDDAPVRRVVVGLDQQLVADVVDDAERVVAGSPG